MADKTISELPSASQVTPSDLFVLEQSGTAKKLTGQILENWLVSYADGHGGIQSISYTAPVAPSLTGTIVITMADETTVSLSLQNGKGITSFTKTGTVGLVDTYRLLYNDATYTDINITNGAKGDTGAADYVYIKYSAIEPTRDADMGNIPDNWMGIAVTTATTAPSHYTDYDWFQIKGATGETGATGATGNGIASIGISGSADPGTTIEITITETDGTISTFEVYNGQDGQGSPSDATPQPLGSADSGVSDYYSRADHVHEMPTPSDIGSATVENYTATIGTTWTGANAPYSQVVSVSGIKATDSPVVDLVPSSTYATAETQLEDWGKIFNIVSGANQITVYATEQTTVSLPIQLLVVR